MKPEEIGNGLRNLPRKRLQELCKKYGLSPYKTKPLLVNSLISFFKAAGVETFEGMECSFENNQSSSYMHSKRGNSFASRFIPQSNGTAFKDTVETAQTSCKSTFESGVNSLHTPFEFSVTSEEGIDLIVDLNSCISDWFKRLENEACICKSLQKQKFQSFRQELQNLGNKQLTSSFPRETYSDYRDHSFEHTVSSPNLCNADIAASDNQDNGDGLLEFSATKSGYYSEKYSVYLGEKEESPLLSRCYSNVQNQNVPNTYLREETGSTHPNAFYASKRNVQTIATSVATFEPEGMLEDRDANHHNVLLPSNGQKTSCFIEDVLAVNAEKEMGQNVKLFNKKSTNIDKQSTCRLEKPMMLQEKHASCLSVHDCTTGLVDAADNIKLDGFSDSCEDDPTPCENIKPKSAGGGHDIISCCTNVNGTHHGKEYSDVLFKGREFASDGKQRRKRSDEESDKDFSCNNGRNLRSSKHLQVFPRRSTRFFSK